jgi:hypothetical protein
MLAQMLAVNPSGLLVFRDEITGLLANWDKQGNEGDRAFYLESWNGTQPYRQDRIGRGEVWIPNHCMSLLGGIQPELLASYLIGISSSLDNDGRMQRFQVLVYPEQVPWTWQDRLPCQGVREGVRDLFHHLSVFDPEEAGAEPRHLAGCYQLSQYGSRWDVHADRVGKPSGTSAVGSVS